MLVYWKVEDKVGRGSEHTFDGVGFSELGAILNQGRGDSIPGLFWGQPEIDVCAGEIVGVELG